MAFNFGITTAVSSVRKQLAPWNIYDVTFKGCSIKEFDGKKDPSAHYKTLNIEYEGEDGNFTVTLFFPKDGDNDRREVDAKNGGKRELPSTFEKTMAIVAQTAEILNPEGFAKMQAASSKFKSFDDVANALISVTNKVKGTATKIKLIGKNKDGKVVADIPNICAVFDHQCKVVDNYVGNKLFFTQYEEGQREKYLNATPTNVEAKVEDPAGIDQAGNDFDLDSLL